MKHLCYNGGAKRSSELTADFFIPADIDVQLVSNQIPPDARTVVLSKNPQPTSMQSAASPVSFRTQTEVGCGFLRIWGLQMKKRGVSYKGQTTWAELIMLYGQNCAYCMEEPAQSVDHVLPWSYSQDSSIDNLRPCCMWCNLHASDKVFDSFHEKQNFLIDKRRRSRATKMRTVCTTCFLPFQRPHMTNSLFECPICEPSKSTGRQRRERESFLTLMRNAGIQPHLHAEIREMARAGATQARRKRELGELYIMSILGQDGGDFALEDLTTWRVMSV